ncbi:pyrophosphate-energized vacuolar membrane proton pump-like protein [Tanacetum coccineum]
MYVLIVAALGMVSTIATGLGIDAYGPVSDTVSGIAKRVGMSHHIRERTDTLDVAGNTIATIGKLLALSFSFFVLPQSTSSLPRLDVQLQTSLPTPFFEVTEKGAS